MEGALDAVRFLASSNFRTEALDELAKGEASRRDLQEAVGGSRSTMARFLYEAESRGWVESTGTRYVLTTKGEAVRREIEQCLENIRVLQELGETVERFPKPLFTLEFRHLADATVIETTSENPTAPFIHSLERFRSASQYRGLTNTSLPEHARVLRDAVDRGQLDFCHVVERAYLEEAWERPDLEGIWEGLVENLYVFDGEVPLNLHVVDDTVLIWLGEAQGADLALLESENPDVVSWARSLFEEFRGSATAFATIRR